MEKEYNMTINRLPAKTWNWLRMNETQLEKIEVPTAAGVKVSLPEKIMRCLRKPQKHSRCCWIIPTYKIVYRPVP